MNNVDNNEGIQGMRILVVEDNLSCQELMVELLNGEGAEVICTENGRKGCEAFAESEPGEIEAVLMDLRMPVMDGYQAARAIRAMDRPDASRVAIIAVSADAFDEDRRKSREAGMDAHLAKPVDSEELFAAIRRYTGR